MSKWEQIWYGGILVEVVRNLGDFLWYHDPARLLAFPIAGIFVIGLAVY